MMDKPEDKIKPVIQKLNIPDKNQLSRSAFPNIPKQVPDLAAPIKGASPDLIIRSFGLPFLEREIYKGRIPIVVRDKPFTTRTSMLNTPIFSDLQFVSFGGFQHIPIDCVLFDVKQSKNIVRTDIQGRDGSIKEYIGLSDYEVTIRGVILGKNGVYPFDQVSNLVEFLRYDQSLGVVSQYLNNIFDINELVIKDYSFEQSEGSQSHQKFELMAYSEKPVEILIQEGK